MRLIQEWNEAIAKRATIAFGSMWAFYIAFFYGFAPLFWPSAESHLLYWSNTVQLWSLPLLMVGSNILGRQSEHRNKEMYRMIQTEFETLKEMHDMTLTELASLRKLHAELKGRK